MLLPACDGNASVCIVADGDAAAEDSAAPTAPWAADAIAAAEAATAGAEGAEAEAGAYTSCAAWDPPTSAIRYEADTASEADPEGGAGGRPGALRRSAAAKA